MKLFEICYKEETVSKTTGTFTVNVLPGQSQNPPVIVPAEGALPDETEGVATADKVATVSGGVPPYNYKFSGQPDGVTFGEVDNGDGTFGVVTQGTPSAGDSANSPYTITIEVTDSAPTPAKAVRSLRVS